MGIMQFLRIQWKETIPYFQFYDNLNKKIQYIKCDRIYTNKKVPEKVLQRIL